MLFLRLDRTLVWKIYFHLRPVRVVKAALQDGKILFLHIVIARVSASTPPKSALPSTMATSIENCSLSLFYLQWVSWQNREQNVGKFRTTKAIFQITLQIRRVAQKVTIPIFPTLADDLRVVVVFCHATSPLRWADYAVEQQSAGSVLWPERDKAQCGIELGPASQQSWLHALKQGENTRWVMRFIFIYEYGRKGRFS